MQIGLIWAQTEAGVIGQDNRMPWSLAEDFAHFKQTTLNNIVIMGRKTWDSLPEKFRPLPQRINIVVSRNAQLQPVGAYLCDSLEQAIELGKSLANAADIWLIGGAQLYQQALSFADRLVVTLIRLKVVGDAFAPPIAEQNWQLDVKKSDRQWRASAQGIEYKFLFYVRKS